MTQAEVFKKELKKVFEFYQQEYEDVESKELELSNKIECETDEETKYELETIHSMWHRAIDCLEVLMGAIDDSIDFISKYEKIIKEVQANDTHL